MSIERIPGACVAAGLLIAMGAHSSPCRAENEPLTDARLCNSSPLEISTQKPAQKSESTAKPTLESGVVHGKVSWSGKLPTHRIDRSSDIEAALPGGTKPHAKSLLVDKNLGMSHVVLYLREAKAEPVAATDRNLELKASTDHWFPYIVTARVGQRLVMNVPKHFQHCIHWKSKRNREWNTTMHAKTQVVAPSPLAAEEKGSAILKCDLHPWEESRVLIFGHPYYATTKSDGSFRIPTKGLAPGQYTLCAWHPKYGRAKLGIQVAASSQITANFSFNRKKQNIGALVPK